MGDSSYTALGLRPVWRRPCGWGGSPSARPARWTKSRGSRRPSCLTRSARRRRRDGGRCCGAWPRRSIWRPSRRRRCRSWSSSGRRAPGRRSRPVTMSRSRIRWRGWSTKRSSCTPGRRQRDSPPTNRVTPLALAAVQTREKGMSLANMARWARAHDIPLRPRGGASHDAALRLRDTAAQRKVRFGIGDGQAIARSSERIEPPPDPAQHPPGQPVGGGSDSRDRPPDRPAIYPGDHSPSPRSKS
ncbi:hypothetical protein SCOCK_690026 [Actinacidiphila cocklensis]|uniref:Uncharacterized protein n=1 Tax=Actinacidiphila cocklensis TaxID=887465 RepID=A0A9W4GVV1_9ACTN|nr:hypothetical protein SCOCK_690026 [Actinacidiphila cocklensis]